ncbi:hypothetical protein ACFOWE_06290 [Planomonospora corallina]|uniref:Uncharacterized protein n=1 Tax=Planomonospora corallina TaxID=1806052 RepID=A0ABV8I4P3_9ACTN
MISNDVLARWDPGAGALTPRDRRRFTVVGLVGLVLAGVGLLVWYSGALVPRFHAFPHGHQADIQDDGPDRPGTLLVHERRIVVNDGLLPVTITGAAGHGPSLVLDSVAAEDGRSLPWVVGTGERLTVVVRYAVTDCETAAETIGLRLRAERWWGTAEADVPFDEAEGEFVGMTGPVTSACEDAQYTARYWERARR